MDFSLYHFAHDPFTTTSEPALLFLSRGQEEALQTLIYSIEGRQGFCMILGESGMGKTTVLRSYLEREDQKHRLKIIYLSGFNLAFLDIVEGVRQRLGISSNTNSIKDVLDKIGETLEIEYVKGKNVVIVLDNVHDASIATLEKLPLLSEIEIDKKKLLQIVLLGRPEFQQTLKRPELRELRRCLSHCAMLSPLTRLESVQYLQHRLARAAVQEEPIFTPRALQRLVKYARGSPRRLDQLCGEALVAGMLQYQHPISVRIVRDVISDFTRRGSAPLGRWKLASVIGTLLFAVLLCGVLAERWRPWWPDVRQAFLQPQVSRPSEAGGLSAIPAPGTVMPEETESSTLAVQEGTTLERISPWSAAVSVAAFPEVPAIPAAPPPRDALFETLRPLAPAESARVLEGSSPQAEQEREMLGRQVALADTSVICVTPRAAGERGKDIVLMDYRGLTKTKLVADGALNLSPILSPDGMRLAYTSYRAGSPAMYLHDLRTAQEERVPLPPGLVLPGSWSPDGRYLALSKSVDGNSDIFLYDVQRQHLRRLTTHMDIDILPSFAPDSTRLVFTSRRDGPSQIYLTDVHGRPPVQLTTVGSYNTSAVWSPHADTIAFIGRTQAEQPLALYTMRADGTDLRRITASDVADETPMWAPDGHFLMYTRGRNGGRERRMVRVDGQEDRAMSGPDSLCQSPQWVVLQ
jgi:type II secretory pathway predicted ATPase ExeA